MSLNIGEGDYDGVKEQGKNLVKIKKCSKTAKNTSKPLYIYAVFCVKKNANNEKRDFRQ